jgi:predicted outer membrane repeat protein
MFNNGEKDGDSNPSLTNVTFSGNSAVWNGGAMFNDGYNGDSNPSLTNVTFSGNSAGWEGGAMFNDGNDTGNSNPSLTNVVFSGNSASQRGGAMFNDGSYDGTSSPTLTNVTFSGNSAGEEGGAMYNRGNYNGTCSPQVRNSIVWNNQADGVTGTITATIYNLTATITLSYSLVEDSGGSGSWALDPTSYVNGGGNIDTDPMFVTPINPSTAPTITGNLRLKTGSPAIDKGDNIYVAGVLTDLDGEARKKDGNGDGSAIVDMGAYEADRHYLLTVTNTGTGSGKVTSSPPGIDCGSICTAPFVENSTVTLTAAADGDSIFTGWSGDCSGSGDCELTIDAAKSVTAIFEAALVFLPLIFR